MSLEDFQLLDNEPLDNSVIKRDFTKIYNRQGDQLNQSDQILSLIWRKITFIIKSVMLI